METPRKIIVVGTSGSGKTTFSHSLSQILNLPHVEMDAFFWQANWVQAPASVFIEGIDKATEEKTWVLDGNWGGKEDDFRTKIFSRADTFVWLDYSFSLVFFRIFVRTLRRILLRQPLWAGNRESLVRTFFTKDSMLFWVIKTYKRRKIQYSALVHKPYAAHLKVVHLKDQAQTTSYLNRLKQCQEKSTALLCETEVAK